MTSKEEFIKLLKENVHRYGVDTLVENLEKEGFFEGPASTKYHGSYTGGLVDHSLNVYYSLLDVMTMIYGKNWQQRHSLESVTVVSLLHDVCKIGKYKPEIRNVKNPNTGTWEQKECYGYNPNSFEMGHASKSIYTVMKYMELTDEEAQAIYWHMGAFDISQYSTVGSLSESYSKNTLALALHLADMISTHVVENENFKPVEKKN